MFQQRSLPFGNPTTVTILLILTLVVVFAVRTSSAAEPDADLAQYFGFEKMEIFKLEKRSTNMLSGDLNNDGLTDLVVVDNSHSRIDLLQQRDKKIDVDKGETLEQDVNELSNHWRFQHRKIPVDKEISAMALGDLNHDGRTDIVYFGLPDRLIIRFQPESGDWTERTSHRLPDVPQASWFLTCGDLNHDGKDDLVVLGKNVTYVIYQQADGKTASPRELMNTSSTLQMASIADLDGDGRNDLSYLAKEGEQRLICARLQDSTGQLGPELRFDLKSPRGSVTLADVDGKPGREILTVDARTNRIKVLQLRRPTAKPGELAGRLIQYGFGNEGADRDRDLATGDLDGDGLTDVVVTDPEAARLIVYRQVKGQGLDSGSTYPALVGASQIRMADLDGNQTAEVVVLSTKEKTVAISRLEAGRLTFPASVPVEHDPLAFELADLDGDDQLEIVYISKESKGRSSNYSLRALKRDAAESSWKPYLFGDSPSLKLELRGTPTRLTSLDANRDGRPDFFVFTGFDSVPKLITTDENGIPTLATGGRGIGLGEIAPGAVFIGQLDQPVVLIARKNFSRNLRLEDNRQWQVVDQYNAAEAKAKIAGSATINLDGQPGNEVVLIDTGVGKLRVLRSEKNVFRPWREVEIGKFPFKSAYTNDLNGDGNDDLLLFGRGKFGVLYAGQTDPLLKEIASFETELKKTFFSDVAAGDLNADGSIDLAAIDVRSHFIEILDFNESRELRHGLHFKLFEEKSIARPEGSGTEPREVLLSDVTNDGLPDLILLTHDRILVYPQDDGKK